MEKKGGEESVNHNNNCVTNYFISPPSLKKIFDTYCLYIFSLTCNVATSIPKCCEVQDIHLPLLTNSFPSFYLISHLPQNQRPLPLKNKTNEEKKMLHKGIHSFKYSANKSHRPPKGH